MELGLRLFETLAGLGPSTDQDGEISAKKEELFFLLLAFFTVYN